MRKLSNFFLFLIFLLIMISGCTNVYQTSEPITPVYRGVFIDQFKFILPHKERNEKLLQWIKEEQFNALLLYDLNVLLRGNKHHEALSQFINQAHKSGIQDISAIGMYTRPLIDTISRFETEKTGHSEKLIHTFFLELEWWNRQSTWEQYSYELKTLYEYKLSLTPELQPEIAAYIGWLSDNYEESIRQAEFLVNHADVIHVHIYQSEPQLSYILPRLQKLYHVAHNLPAEDRPQIVFMFSIELEFSARLIRDVSYNEIFTYLIRQIQQQQENGNLPPNFLRVLKIQGYAVFAQSFARS